MFDPKRGYPTVVPYVRYADPPRALEWLTEVLDAAEAVRLTLPDGRIGHAELRVGRSAAIAVGVAASPPGAIPGDRSAVRAMTLVFVDDVDRATHRAVERGGTMIDAPTDMPWGVRQAIVADPEGHLWELSAHVVERDATQWGADLVGPWFYRPTTPTQNCG